MPIDYIRACEIVDELASVIDSGKKPDVSHFGDEDKESLLLRVREKIEQMGRFFPPLDLKRQHDRDFMESDFMREYAAKQNALVKLGSLLLSKETRKRIAGAFVETVLDGPK